MGLFLCAKISRGLQIEVGFSFLKDHPKAFNGLFRSVVAALHIALHQGGIAFPSWTVTTTTGCRDANRVSDFDGNALILGEVRRDVGFIAALAADLVDPTVLAAQHSLRTDPSVIHHHRGPSGSSPQPHLVIHTKTSALLACAS